MSENVTQKIVDTIRKRRLSLGYSQEYMAGKMNISQNSYSKIEIGKTPVVLSRLFFICTLLNISPSDLFNNDAPSGVDFSKLFYLEDVPMWLIEPITLKFLEVNNCAIATYGYTYEKFLEMTIHDIRKADEKGNFNISFDGDDDVKFMNKFHHKLSNGDIKPFMLTRYMTTYNNKPVYLIRSELSA